MFELAWREASAEFPVRFLLISARKKNVLLHMKLCRTRVIGQEPLGSVVMGFPKKIKNILVLVLIRRLELDFICI